MPSYEQENFKESNVNYLNKDFSQYKESLINYAKAYFPDSYRDFNETSPGMMLMEMSAYVGDVLSFYIDQQYKEMLLPLAEERRNIINLAKMFGYKVKPIIPAYAEITFTSELDSNNSNGDPSTIDYTSAGVWESGIEVTSLSDSNIKFTTLEPVDFSITQSGDLDDISSVHADTGLATKYRLTRTVRAVSAEEKTKSFSIGSPTKFLRLTIPDTNVVDIVSVVDTNGNNWYEVDYLAQDRIPAPIHYTQEDRENAYYSFSDNDPDTDERREVAVPYSLEYITTNKRFTRETNSDNTTSLIFGNGILKNGTTVDGSFLDLEQAGVVIPGQTYDLQDAINPLLGDVYSTLGETPIQTTLTVTYRVGGGVSANVAVANLTEFSSPTPDGGSPTATLTSATNNSPAMGGRDLEEIEEIREKSKAFFTTQNRCVTKEDYEARVMNIPPNLAGIANVLAS